mmetsp:Transcript_18450/g.46673  ORF Transcript_18450/g.46673 Transcript_18450/m.46673 type:complete len:112 (+) Transcript_18450:914-1249(+)
MAAQPASQPGRPPGISQAGGTRRQHSTRQHHQLLGVSNLVAARCCHTSPQGSPQGRKEGRDGQSAPGASQPLGPTHTGTVIYCAHQAPRLTDTRTAQAHASHQSPRVGKQR